MAEASRYVSIYTCFLVLEKDKYILVLKNTYNYYKQQQQKEKMKCIFCGTMFTMGIFIILGNLFVLSNATPGGNDGKNNGGNLFPIGNQKSITGVNGDSKNDIKYFLRRTLFSNIRYQVKIVVYW